MTSKLTYATASDLELGAGGALLDLHGGSIRSKTAGKYKLDI